MQSKTSFFNKTAFRKNLTRFAPVWVLYTICLLLGLFLVYTDGGGTGFQRDYRFVRTMSELFSVMGVVNLGYALLVAQLLFGDLFQSRMCNMLHALPLRRESWFATHVLSGMVFSLVPTAVMALVSLPLLMGNVYKNAWLLAPLLFAASNLQYLCFFGLAAFSAMCVGNRFTMAAGYGLLNAGAYIFYWLVDTVYTPLLYGVVTPTALAIHLTPMYHMVEFSFVKYETRAELVERFGEDLIGVTAQIQTTEHWWRLFAWAGVGLVFLAAALMLYRKRNLECAGDAVAYPCLVPVFQVLCAVVVMTGGQFFLYAFLGLDQNYLILAAGLVIGWFIGRMLIERSTRVFRLRNWYGLAALSAALLVTLGCTHFDILGIETRLPKAERVAKVHFDSSYVSSLTTEEEADIQNILRLNEKALEVRAESPGSYVLGTNGQWVKYVDTYSSVIEEEDPNLQYRYVARINLCYELTNGNKVRREYNVWVDSEAGRMANELLNRWEMVNDDIITLNGETFDRLDLVLNEFRSFSVDYLQENGVPQALKNREAAEAFLAAVRADCAEGHMAQDPYFHTGLFRVRRENAEKGYYETDQIWVGLEGEKYGWDVRVYPDSRHTVAWLEENGLLPDVEVNREGNVYR
ncbi:MAG: hypothetical protein IJD98_03945 [Oscillospiraceae bacterium]|nr:hypothetical protein [Oscillospiraceae bacterium]